MTLQERGIDLEKLYERQLASERIIGWWSIDWFSRELFAMVLPCGGMLAHVTTLIPLPDPSTFQSARIPSTTDGFLLPCLYSAMVMFD